MRLGELLGLRWRDIEIKRGKLQVCQSVQEDGYQFVLAEPKTTNSRRTIGLSRLAIHALREHQARQAREKAKLGPAWDDSLDLVFPNTIGGIMIPDNLAKRSFKQFLLKAGLPNIRFHDLWHTAATLLLKQGVNVKVVSEMLGHANVSITLRIYAHVLPDMQQEAANMADDVFGFREAEYE